MTDQLPEELDVTRARPYRVPDISRRRIAAVAHGIVAAAAVAGFAVSGNGGLLAGAVFLLVVAGYHLACAWPLRLDETAALAAAARATDFPVGHASAQLGWRGLRSRPTWRILLYSAEDPPERRGMVLVDGIDGAILGDYVEKNPEDWSSLG